MSACLLAFDTATESMALALLAGGRRWARELPGGALASSTLLPAIQEMLRGAGIGMHDLDAIAFGRGPGAFTGLRTSCAVAQGLALGIARPVLAIDSLQIVAEATRLATGSHDIGVCMDARMQEIYAARWCWDGARWSSPAGPALFDLEGVRRLWADAPEVLAGTACAWPGAPWGLPVERCLVDPGGRAQALLALAERAWHAGEAIDPAEALPVYVRDKVALTTAERAQARAATEARA